MKLDFSIDPQLRALIPPLSTEELEQLKDNLLVDGCRDPLVVGHIDGRHVLLDGHNRYDLCCAEQIPFTAVVAPHVTTYQEAERCIINNQLGRRNLTPEQTWYLQGRRYNLEKRQGERTDLTSAHVEQKFDTAEQLAQEYNVSRATIVRSGQFADAVEILAEVAGEDVRQEILSGEAGIAKQDVIGLARVAEREPEHARELYTRGTAGDGIALEPELVEAERKRRRSFRGRKRAFQILISLAQDMAQVTTSQTAEQVRQWGDLLFTAAMEAQRGADEADG